MNIVKDFLKEKYQLSNYQIAQLAFVFKTYLGELSKMLIMGFLFHRQLKLYLFLLFLMCLLRSFSGGIHFYTYKGCLLGSIIYMGTVIYILSRIEPPVYLQLFGLLICIISCYAIGPVLSKYRTNFPEKQLCFCRNITCLIIFAYAIITYIIPANPYSISGFWMIILHSLQLYVAKIRKKGGEIRQ